MKWIEQKNYLTKCLISIDSESILGALDEMSRMNRNELWALSKLCEIINRAEAAEELKAKDHQPN